MGIYLNRKGGGVYLYQVPGCAARVRVLTALRPGAGQEGEASDKRGGRGQSNVLDKVVSSCACVRDS